YFGVGQTGSGIGESRNDRRALQVAVSQAEKQLHPDVAANLEKIIGVSFDGDIIHKLMKYINDPKNQAAIHDNAAELTQAVTDFIGQLRTDAQAITDLIAPKFAQQPPVDPAPVPAGV